VLRIHIAKVGIGAEAELGHLLEQYVRDMSAWFDFQGTYDLSSVWASGAAYLATAGATPVGFALISAAGAGYDMQEFFGRQEFRSQTIGRTMARFVWNDLPGDWTVRVLEANEPALNFWRRTIAGATEEVRIVHDRTWRIFRFSSRRATL
jgi:predicted acetyltransferase